MTLKCYHSKEYDRLCPHCKKNIVKIDCDSASNNWDNGEYSIKNDVEYCIYENTKKILFINDSFELKKMHELSINININQNCISKINEKIKLPKMILPKSQEYWYRNIEVKQIILILKY